MDKGTLASALNYIVAWRYTTLQDIFLPEHHLQFSWMIIYLPTGSSCRAICPPFPTNRHLS
jgi:hypothetical protein